MAICLAELDLPSRVTPEGQRIAQVFKELRSEARLTQEEAAERAGLTLAGYRPYEQGKRQLRTEQFKTFADAFGVPTSVLADRLRLTPAEPGGDLRHELATLLPDVDAAELDDLTRRLATLPPADRRQVLDGWRDHLTGRLSRLGRA